MGELSRTDAQVLADYLAARELLVVGHSGWNDAVVAALGMRETRHTLYWCDMAVAPTDRIAGVLAARRGPTVYVQLDKGGADGLMTALNEALNAAQPPTAWPQCLSSHNERRAAGGGVDRTQVGFRAACYGYRRTA